MTTHLADDIVIQENTSSIEGGYTSNAIFTVRLPDDLKAELDLLAKATNRSKSYLATKAIADYLQRNAWQIRELRQATTDRSCGIARQAIAPIGPDRSSEDGTQADKAGVSLAS